MLALWRLRGGCAGTPRGRGVEGKEPPSTSFHVAISKDKTYRRQKLVRETVGHSFARAGQHTACAQVAASHNRTAKPVSQAPPAPAPRLLLGAPPVRSLAVLLARALADGDEARLDGLDGAPSAAVVALRGEAPGRWVGCGCGCCVAGVVSWCSRAVPCRTGLRVRARVRVRVRVGLGLGSGLGGLG